MAEIVVLFVIAPLAMRIAVYDYGVPMFYALGPVLALMLALLFLDPSYHFAPELRRTLDAETVRSIVTCFAVGGIMMALVVWTLMPDRFMALPLSRPTRWMKIMLLYPFTSVLAQEFVYRVFFFHRYGPLFSRKLVLIVVSGILFGLAHALFRNWIAVGLSALGGALFAWRYARTQSFAAVWLEHTLWGWLIFTIGLGVFFFTGVSNPTW
ncbi:MAG: CPBP family intramembrane glutamic endopeptidase [Hyphomicrobium sp.]